MPACVVPAVAAGGEGMVNPPTRMYCGTPAAPSQLAADALPVPGHEWQDEQSCAEVAVKAL